MTYLGFGGSGHEWACAGIQGDRIVAVAEERLTRKKYGLGADLLAARSRKTVLSELGADGASVQAVACDLVPRTFYHAVRDRTAVIGHHLAHAYCAFATSGAERAAILVVDNSGSILEGGKVGRTRLVETVSMYEAGPDGIRLLQTIAGEHVHHAETEAEYYQAGKTSNSLGHLYRTASIALGFGFRAPTGGGVFSEDGKTMGLAPYGDDRFVDAVGAVVDLHADGGMTIDLDKIDGVIDSCLRRNDFQHRAALAYAVQFHTERVLLHYAKRLHAATGLDTLCVCGGVGLNSVANGVLQAKSPFRRVHVPPAPGDDGISLGCAHYARHALGGEKLMGLGLRDAFLGPSHGPKEIEQAIAVTGAQATWPDDLAGVVASQLAGGGIVGWYRDRAEFGPRALGHRSILASPVPGFMRDRLNHEVKRREWFRPYGPMVPSERAAEFFDFDGHSPFMSFVAAVRRPEALPAATHVDGTARLQTVSADENPAIHALLGAFEAKTGTPILLNTSFNLAGEPIVETPLEAIDAARRMGLNALVLGDALLSFDD